MGAPNITRRHRHVPTARRASPGSLLFARCCDRWRVPSGVPSIGGGRGVNLPFFNAIAVAKGLQITSAE